MIDHNSELYRTRGTRVAAMIGGSLLEKKTAVLNSLVALAKAR